MNDFERGYERYKDFVLDRSNDLKEFMSRSRLNALIIIEVGSRRMKGSKGRENLYSFEELCDAIPRQIGSRSSVLKILNECVEREFFIKTSCNEDKRFRQYELHDDHKSWFDKYVEYLGHERKEVK